MAKNCIFCGEEIAAFTAKKITCGDYTMSVCPDCFDKYGGLKGVELAEKILATGRSRHEDYYRTFIDHSLKIRQEAEEREKKKEEEFNSRHPETGKCPKCGGPILQYDPVSIKLGEETFLFSDLNRLMTGSLTIRPNRCKACGYTEFFTPNENELL